MFEIGRSKRAQQAFAFDDIAIVPSRRTRGEEQVNLTWRIDAFTFDFPLIAAPMDSVMSPATAIEMGRLGGLGVLNLEGLWTRYADPEPLLEEIAAIDDPGAATRRMQELYAEPIKEELIGQRVAEVRSAGSRPRAPCRRRTPRRTPGRSSPPGSTSSSSAAPPSRPSTSPARRSRSTSSSSSTPSTCPSSSAAARPTRPRCT